MKNFIKDGTRMPYTNGTGADIPSGRPVVVGDIVGVTCGIIKIGEEGELQMDGVVELTKDAPLVIGQGEKLYWVVADLEISKTAGISKIIGYAHKSALSADTLVLVKLVQLGA